MNIKTGLLTAATGLIVGLTGCGSSATEGPTAPGTLSHVPTPSPSPATSEPARSEPGTSTAPGAASTAGAVAAQPAVIKIKDFRYTVPASVAPGARITVNNQDGQNHTVTSATKGVFEVTAVGGGTGALTAPNRPGSYMFACSFHANMTGTLVVR
jgi:plastocyanin